ncbi:MAG: rRNA (cytosine967-C5)-methyltransferase [Alphaproteobacteria bacterium]|jgi:16S rRNA (cytosine967-C5)-methyltransferase|nr:rRNA (cytosine967-C5)-methyltransferase [Alphaproteobacteria bacterium]
MPDSKPSTPTPSPGLAARRIAADIVGGVLRQKRPLDEQLEHSDLGALPERDRALVRTIVATVLRRLGTLRHLLANLLEKGMPPSAPKVEDILLIGAAQILFLDVPDHASVDLSVRLAQADHHASHYSGLVNAVLRKLARDGKGRLAGLDTALLDTPDWLMQRWIAHYGQTAARAIAAAHTQEPALDLTVKSDPRTWATTLNGRLLDTGTVRTIASGPIPQLPGYAEGEWWVQDAAAALPARLLGEVRGKSVADLCAAPGGKTAQLAQAGARVTAVDRSAPRLERVRQNLARLRLGAEIVKADASAWEGGPFDAVLVDAPCSSTGTIRRHPDIPWLKSEVDLAKLTALQTRLLDRAAMLLKPGGTLVYCTCSLEAEEGENQIAALLGRNPALRRSPIRADEVAGHTELLTPQGELRTLPCYWAYDPEPRMGGLDGFYAARVIRHDGA